MSFLDKPVGQLSMADLQRLISTEVGVQTPAIPAGVLALSDLAQPLVMPPNPSDGQVLTYSGGLGGIQLGTVKANFIATGTLNVGAGGVTIQSAPSGSSRIVIDGAGIHMFDASDNPVVDLPTDSSKTAYFAGTVTASSFIGTNTQLSMTQLQTGGTLGLQAGVASPLAPPGASLSSGGLLVAGTRYYISFSWYDGTHETGVGPNGTVLPYITTSPFKTARVVIPPAPTGVTQARIYMGTSPFTPGSGNGHLQTTVSVSSTVNTTVSLTSFNNAGAVPPATNNFPAGTTAYVFPAGVTDSAGGDYGWRIEGNGRIRFLGPTIQNQFWMYDEFIYTSGEFPTVTGSVFGGPIRWVLNGTGTGFGVGAGVSTAQQPGAIQLTTGTTTTGISTIRAGAAISTGSARIRGSFKFMLDNIPGASNAFFFAIGLSNQGLSTGNTPLTAALSGITIDNSTATGAGVLRLTYCDGTTLQHVSSGIVPTGGTWYFCEFEVDAARTGINWWINGAKQAAGIPSGIPTVGTLMGMMATIQKTAGTTARTLNLDNVAVYGDYVSG